MKKSIKINVLLNSMKTMLSTLFPIVTFSYVSRILEVESIGNYNFYLSIVSYFQLFAMLGIQTYAICEGSSKRENKKEIDRFAGQMYSIQTMASLLSLSVLFIMTALIGEFRENWLLIVILSSTILFNVIGVEWVFSVYEDYIFITVRYIFVQLITIILIFIFVKTKNDYISYVLISILPVAVSNLLNFFYKKKYCHIKFTFFMNLKEHIYSLLTIFTANAATIVYLNSDMTMLGIISGEKYVGLYSLSAKIYNILKSIASASVVVTIPKLKMLSGEGKLLKHKILISELLSGLLLLILPISAGLFCLSEECVLIVGGNSYLPSSITLKILSAAMIFAVLNGLTTTAILLPLKKEKIVLTGTLISAVLNIVLNLILLKQFKQEGAAFTTLLSELFLFCFTIYYSKKYIDFKIVFKNMKIAVLSMPLIIINTFFIKNIFHNLILKSILAVLINFLIYLILLLLTNNVFREILKKIITNVKKEDK